MGLDLSHSIPVIPAQQDLLEYFTLEELSKNVEYVRNHTEKVVLINSLDFEKKLEVIYFQEIGSLRKGMNKNFYHHFENGKPYFKIADVETAFNFLEADHINSLQDLQTIFKNNFLENFVEGQSIFYASW